MELKDESKKIQFNDKIPEPAFVISNVNLPDVGCKISYMDQNQRKSEIQSADGYLSDYFKSLPDFETKPNQCFGNSMSNVLNHPEYDFIYVEGVVATGPNQDVPYNHITAHAWLKMDGKIIELTTSNKYYDAEYIMIYELTRDELESLLYGKNTVKPLHLLKQLKKDWMDKIKMICKKWNCVYVPAQSRNSEKTHYHKF